MINSDPSLSGTLPPNLFLAQPKNAERLAGSTRRVRGRYEAGILLMLILLSCCLLSNRSLFGSTQRWIALRDHGQDAPGVVTDLATEGAGRSATYWVSYRFTAIQNDQPAEQNGRQAFTREDYPPLKVGDPVPVRYLKGDPRVSSISWRPALTSGEIWTLVVVLAMLLGVLGVLAWRVWAVLRLRGDAQLVIGEVVESRIKPVKSERQLWLKYRFRTPDTQEIVATETVTRGDLPERPLPPGTPVAVIYASPRIYQLL
jgi:hypothetical protein